MTRTEHFDIWYDNRVEQARKNLPSPNRCKENELVVSIPIDYKMVYGMAPKCTHVKFRKTWGNYSWKWKRLY